MPLTQTLVFSVHDRLYAIPLEIVQRVVPIVEVTLLPDSPDTISGLINWHGKLIPVLSMRRYLGLVDQDPEIADHFVIVQARTQIVALWVDSVVGVVEQPETDRFSTNFIVGSKQITGKAMKLQDKIVLFVDVVHHLDGILS